MSIAADGSELLIGAPYANQNGRDTGAVFVFQNRGILVNTISSPVLVSGALFGQSVAVSPNRFIIGAPRAHDTQRTQSGAVYVFDRKTKELRFTLQNPRPGHGAFGHTVVARHRQILVGDPLASLDGSFLGGAAYLFDAKTGEFLRTFSPRASEQTRPSRFGHSVQLAEEFVLVSAPSGVSQGIESGLVYLFHRQTGELVRTFAPPAPIHGLLFGWDVSTNGRVLLVGAIGFQGRHREEGIVYGFDLKTGTLIDAYRNPHPTDQGRFGQSVEWLMDAWIVAAPGDHIQPSGKIEGGTIYFINQSSGKVIQTLRSPHPATGAGDLFGESLFVHQGSLYVGAPFGGVSAELDAGITFRFHVDTPQ